MATTGLLDHFSALKDPRQAWKVVYPLQEVLLIVLCGTMAGAEDFADIERWAKRKLDFLRRFLPFVRGIPSHDTLNDVMNALPAQLFSECFIAWVESLRERAPDIVAIDGKTSRRAHAAGGAPLHLVSAWASRQRLVLGQEAVDKKSNEIVAIPRLLERLELQGALVTIDAMGCQREIAEAIRAKGADYLLALKDNWPTLAEDVRLFFERETAAKGDVCVTVDGDHGRIETPRCRVSQDVAWLSTNRRFPGEPRFPGLATLGKGEDRGFVAVGLSRAPWRSAQPIRNVFRAAFAAAGLIYANPHSFRTTLGRYGERICRTPEEWKAWSLNLGHENEMTTFVGYGHVPTERRAEIMRALAAPRPATLPPALDIAALKAFVESAESAPGR
jgi:predicted transposase YbfD/YdcC